MEVPEVAWTLVVVASAGSDLLDFLWPGVNCNEGDLVGLGVVAFRTTADAASEVTFPTVDMLSRATCVTGAALRGQVRLNQLCKIGVSEGL